MLDVTTCILISWHYPTDAGELVLVFVHSSEFVI